MPAPCIKRGMKEKTRLINDVADYIIKHAPEKLSLAVANEDKKSIASANGIGAKTAARLILELKDKLKAEGFSPSDEAEQNDISDIFSSSDKRSDAISALSVLGYTRAEAEAVIKKIDITSLEVDDIIKEALKRLMR